MVQIPTEMDVLHNQTYTDISDFQHNETNFIQNSSDSNSTDCFMLGGWTGVLGWDYVEVAVYWVVFLIAFPGISFALYKLRSQVRPDQVAPVYVTNLLISDLIQVCANPIKMTFLLYYPSWDFYPLIYSKFILLDLFLFGVQVNVLFMMCISAERYVMTAHAVWYRNIQNRKISIIVSVIIWILSAVSWITYCIEQTFTYVTVGVVLLVPYPVVMFFFVATWRALCRSSVPRNDQMRIRAILGLVLGIYTVVCLPFTITLFTWFYCSSMVFMPYILIALNPLFDLLLYVLIRRDVTHVWRALLSCCNRRQEANIANG